MQLSNIDVYKQNNVGIWIISIRIIYMKAVWGHARAELIEAEDTIIKWGERKNKGGNGRGGQEGGGGEAN